MRVTNWSAKLGQYANNIPSTLVEAEVRIDLQFDSLDEADRCLAQTKAILNDVIAMWNAAAQGEHIITGTAEGHP